jgi:DNA-binding HxlR family transcriptional regulator
VNDQELLEKYQYKLATQLWLYMIQKYPGNKKFTLEELTNKFKRSDGVISRALKDLDSNGMIDRNYTTKNYANGARLKSSLTQKGLRLGKKLAYEWLNKNEKSLLKGLNVVQT